ncbi:hypothetical protein H4219_002905 [Mycoemilia scoparia]|uniref:DNA/RNA-binding protein Kin17 WH-like domain-containing protein n=1 Tax=Mycoemilia scoparia TaxID=417184 RepID=A0A9W8DQ00_9FUNG|nr:hypothetical protein H4219_002905 [Mycoemilia scoparia]
MGKGDFLTPKAIANRMKAKGLQRLRWYCQMCQKQCRDENGFKCHCASESHQRQMALFADSPEKFMESFSKEFQDEFVKVLSRRYGTTRVLANQVYQEIVADRQHMHMNSTHWDTLTDFVKHLGKSGICHVDETERGWFIQWIDNSPAALARREAIKKKERQTMDDEEREKKLLNEQIERASQREKGPEGSSQPEFTELKRSKDGETIKLKMTTKIGSNASKPGLSNVFKKNIKTTTPLKQLNKPSTDSSGRPKKVDPFASLKKSSKDTQAPKKDHSGNGVNARPRSAVEEIVLEEQKRKQKQLQHRSGYSHYHSSSNNGSSSHHRAHRGRSRSPSPQRRSSTDRHRAGYRRSRSPI